MDDYAARQSDRDRAYERAYTSPEASRWIAEMPAEDRQRLQRQGLLKPCLPRRASGTLLSDDLADTVLASETPDIIAEIEPDEAESESDTVATPARSPSDVLASFCARLCGSNNPSLAFDAVCYGMGVLALEGESATQLAAKHGVSKQAFSKLAVQWCETFGLRPSRSMKSKLARKAYRERTKAFHDLRRLTRKQSV
ncbi:hypothetical protein DB346_09795 [Verrucomicrobia bacterium LW23]|nr:hypothetical protein DB346_09795 [Verrucomicrobia bacterium LW23]